MKYYVMTLFPEMFEQVMGSSIMGKAIDQGLIELEIFNIRDFTLDKHNKVDDYPYGGGAGMVRKQSQSTAVMKKSVPGQENARLLFI